MFQSQIKGDQGRYALATCVILVEVQWVAVGATPVTANCMVDTGAVFVSRIGDNGEQAAWDVHGFHVSSDPDVLFDNHGTVVDLFWGLGGCVVFLSLFWIWSTYDTQLKIFNGTRQA